MLFLLFQLGKEAYALEAAEVHEVLPLVGLTEIPLSPRGVAGVFNYRGTPVPVLDLSELLLKRPAEPKLSTRIILVNYPDARGKKQLLGLIAEKSTETLRRGPGDFISSGLANEEAPYLGPVTPGPPGFIQWVRVDQLLPASLRDLLFQEPAESSSR